MLRPISRLAVPFLSRYQILSYSRYLIKLSSFLESEALIMKLYSEMSDDGIKQSQPHIAAINGIKLDYQRLNCLSINIKEEEVDGSLLKATESLLPFVKIKMSNNLIRGFQYRNFFLPTQAKQPLLLTLRNFEVSIISKFLPFSHKLKVLMLLSRSWLTFIFQNYAWTQFPCHSAIFLLSGYLNFLSHFQDLGGIDVRYFHGDFITPQRVALLSTAKSVCLQQLEIPKCVRISFQNPPFVEKITSLEIHIQSKKELNFLMTAFESVRNQLHSLIIEIYQCKDAKGSIPLDLKRLEHLTEFKIYSMQFQLSLVFELTNLPRGLKTLFIDGHASFKLLQFSKLSALTTYTNMEASLFEKSLLFIPLSVTKVVTSDSFTQSHIRFIRNIQVLHLQRVNSELSFEDLPSLQRLRIVLSISKQGAIRLRNLPSFRVFVFYYQKIKFPGGIRSSLQII